MNGDLFVAPTLKTTPQDTSTQATYPPPQRACFVCGAEDWMWDKANEMWLWGGDQQVHAQRLRQQWIWVDGKIPASDA